MMGAEKTQREFLNSRSWVTSSWKYFCQSNLPLPFPGHWPFPTSHSGFPISDSRVNISMDWSSTINLKVNGVQLQDFGIGISKASSSGCSRGKGVPEEGTAAGDTAGKMTGASCRRVCQGTNTRLWTFETDKFLLSQVWDGGPWTCSKRSLSINNMHLKTLSIF